jgi:hypothetical protein
MLQWFEGKKTYVVAVAVIVGAAAQFVTGEMSLGEAINAALVGLGLGTLRAGVAKA